MVKDPPTIPKLVIQLLVVLTKKTRCVSHNTPKKEAKALIFRGISCNSQRVFLVAEIYLMKKQK